MERRDTTEYNPKEREKLEQLLREGKTIVNPDGGAIREDAIVVNVPELNESIFDYLDKLKRISNDNGGRQVLGYFSSGNTHGFVSSTNTKDELSLTMVGMKHESYLALLSEEKEHKKKHGGFIGLALDYLYPKNSDDNGLSFCDRLEQLKQENPSVAERLESYINENYDAEEIEQFKDPNKLFPYIRTAYEKSFETASTIIYCLRDGLEDDEIINRLQNEGKVITSEVERIVTTYTESGQAFIDYANGRRK